MPQFYETRMGQKFYEGTLPRLVGVLERIATALEALVEKHPTSELKPEKKG